MKHYGDITKIHGAAVEPVNVVIGGSPCQDLSVAGKQKGIKHIDNGDDETTRSGLFMEQLRIIKEMRRNDIEHGRTGIYTRPRFMVWENVPGAFSSNKGADFGAVLEETIKVVYEKSPPLFLSLNADGQTPDALPTWQENGALRGEFSTHSFGESPKEERGSHLLQILEDSPHPKYYLSAKACAGILNRADRRGKILPPKLREALERQSGLSAFRVTGSTEPKPQAVTEKDGQRESATPSTPLTAPQSPSFPSTCETPPVTQQVATPAGGGSVK